MYGTTLDEPQNSRDTLVKSNFAVYEISFGDSLRVDSVRVLTGFNQLLDTILIDRLKRAHWGGRRITGNRVERIYNPGKLLVAFYHYPAEDKHAAFVTQYDL